MAEEEARAITPIDSEGDEGKLFHKILGFATRTSNTGSCCKSQYFVVWGANPDVDFFIPFFASVATKCEGVGLRKASI